MILHSTLPSSNIKCFILALIVLVFHTGAGWWTIFQLRVDIMSPAATRRLPQTFISCVCPSVRRACWTLFALSHLALRVDIVSPAAIERLPQTFICCVCQAWCLCVCPSVRRTRLASRRRMHLSRMPELASNVCVRLILALVVVRLENVGANRTVDATMRRRRQNTWVFAPRASFTFKC